jgi:hypothetical protein
MTQTFTEDCFAAGHVGLTDLQNMENNFMALKTLFSGSSAPSNSTGGMPWFDTSKKILKLRNSTNGAWLGVHYSSTESRWWVYANTAGDGWIIDSSVSDRVLAIKGGTQAYNSAGGTGAGTWTIAGITASNNTANHYHDIPHAHTLGTDYAIAWSWSTEATQLAVGISVNSFVGNSSYNSQAHNHPISQDATWRPLASIGTLQYLDL